MNQAPNNPGEAAYREACAKALLLSENASWETINSIRDSVRFAAQNAIEETRGEDSRKVMEQEMERQRRILELGLDENISGAEIGRFIKLGEFSPASEAKRMELTDIFRLRNKNASWEEIYNLFHFVKILASRQCEADQELPKKVCELLEIPESMYEGLAENVGLGRDLDAYRYLVEERE